MQLLRLMTPGLSIKRWLGLTLLGLTIVALGMAYAFVEIYRSWPFPEVATTLTLQFLPRWLRALIFVATGLLVTAFALVRLNRTLMAPIARSQNAAAYVDALVSLRNRERGPRIVAIGGGTGLSTMLRGLKHHSTNITAIVTVADDGGSSGRLRRDMGVLPPGDFRNCIVALADAEPLMAQLLQYRFGEGTDLEGHSFGNLFIVAMSEITGSFEEGVLEASRVLAVRGQIFPPTLQDVTLCGQLMDGSTVRGESAVGHATNPIDHVYLEPARPAAYPEAVRAIHEADLIVVGPGSLYTSILPNLLVDGIRKAVMSSSAYKVYVCNVATQPGETDGFGLGDHVRALLAHIGDNPFHVVLANSDLSNSGDIKPEWHVQSVTGTAADLPPDGPELVLEDVVNPHNPLRHSPEKLAAAILRLYDERGRAARSSERVPVAI
ncbi:MAG: gluconeogenesis factor YvcK family protein [Chloroflexota bacterium]